MAKIASRVRSLTLAICSFVAALFTGGMLGANTANATEMLTAYTYHDYPPYVFKSGDGLAQDMVEKLNQESKGRVEYQLKVLSRPELDQLMTKPDFRGVVLWVSPLWFKVDNADSTVWSRPLLRDAQVIISRKAKPVVFVASDSLTGKRFGGVRGQRYVGIDELIADGRTQREDGVDERAILRMLDAGKVDAIALPQSVTNLLVQETGMAEKVYVAPLPLNTYSRHILFRNVPKAAIASAQKMLATLPQNAQWQATLANYRLEDAENSTRALVRLCFNNYPP